MQHECYSSALPRREKRNEMAQGTVKWFNPEKGYGFISQADGEERCVHCCEVREGGFRTF